MRRVHIDYGFFFLAAVLLLMLPLRWVLACFLAAAIHECGHFLAVLICGGRIVGGSLSFRHARMDAAGLSAKAELLCLLAGPAASLMLVPLMHVFPRLALCGLVQGCYNLLPIGNLDGKKALRCIRSLVKTRTSHRNSEKLLAKMENR